ncbi:MAG: HD domain-containing protein [Lachnospiraceae bacterium]|nr:HD domain-containing protein [Lachnospiraceae bacterium]
MKSIFEHKKNTIIHPAVDLLIVAALLLNLIHFTAVRLTDLPFYIDTVGTIVATALGGIVPGLVTAFLTNTVNSFMDGKSIFYAPLNMLIALVAAGFFGDFASYRKMKRREAGGEKKGKLAGEILDYGLFTVVLSLIGGGIGGAITWFLYAAPSTAPVSVAISEWLSGTFGTGVIGCHMLTTLVTDLLDKLVSVALSVMIIRTVPRKLKDLVRFSAWRQKPLSYEEGRLAGKGLTGRVPIGVRINTILIFSIVLVTAVMLGFSVSSFRDSIRESLSKTAEQVAYLAAGEIDPAKVDAYIKNGYSEPGYNETRNRLSNIKNSSSDITFLYVYKIEGDGCRVVFDLDSVSENGLYVSGDQPGEFVKFEDASLPYLSDLREGKKLPVVRLTDQYGDYLASYQPVLDANGRCVCYAVSNVEYKLANALVERYFGRVLLLFSGFLILIVAFSILTTKYHIVMPIRSMTVYANELTGPGGGANEKNLKKIEELDIRTGDETEQLYRSFCKLTGDTVYQLNENHNKSDAISKMQNALIITMADMVESRDSDTGAHVLKTTEYVHIILQGLKRNGYYSEKLTDKFIRDVEMSAPLHDVGKINIPDAILNKPGKLTDEEFAIMKTHTTAGKKILENAISSMEGDNYLKEARNMAAYHHERWDGKGYPEGLHGEVIPLSARVMAVADVFDALSSPRVYKPAFPFDKAVQMIRDGAGTQFDPKCTEVFLESLPEVRKTLRKYQEL